jgi:diguanylate cyclase (GGDEF)-like protein
MSDEAPPAPAYPTTANEPPTPRGSRRRWQLLAAAVLVLGLVLSVASALFWRASVHDQERQSFQVAATDVSETLEMQLRRDTEFVTTLRAVLTMQPGLSASGFREWFRQIEGPERGIGGLGTLVVRPVARGALGGFLAARNADPAFRTLVGGRVQPVTPAGRARYCLLAAGAGSVPYSPPTARMLQGNWCSPRSQIGSYPTAGTTQARLMPATTASGHFLVYGVKSDGVSNFFLEGAFYRRGVPLTSAAQRSAALLGWVSSSFDIPTLIHSALVPHRGLVVTLYHSNLGDRPALIGRVGSAPEVRFSRRTTVPIDGIGTWILSVRGNTDGGGLSAAAQALLVLAGGTLLSLLLFALLLLLTRSRAHALGMVAEKTGQLRHQALHDALTGLPNRVLALDRAEQMLARARRQNLPVAALYVDVDGFKHVNDTFGHAAGDQLLRIVAQRLASVVREGDTAARLGGDEFVVLVEGASLNAGPELVAERVLEVLRQPYDMNGEIGRAHRLTASIGIAYGLRESADELLRDADLALYEAKAAGKNCQVLFEAGMQTAAENRLALELDLAGALTREELFLLYQPTFDLESERVIGVEALLRWQHPTRGVIAPDEFVPLAEENRQIVPIGRWVLHEACRQAAAWHSHGEHIGMAVNVSGRQLDHDTLIDDVRGALQESGLEPQALTLEITETALMRDAEATARRLRELKRLGVRIAIDDFGTGYSSLAYLRQFPVDALKIDRSFIGGIAASKESAALIHTLVQLGKTLELETLAEGIEDQVQLETLQREHCDHGQGFLFSRPLAVDAIEDFVHGNTQAASRTPDLSHTAHAAH